MRKKTVSLISLLAFCIATLGIIILNGCSSDGVVEASETPLNFTILTDSTVEVAETISHVEMREVILQTQSDPDYPTQLAALKLPLDCTIACAVTSSMRRMIHSLDKPACIATCSISGRTTLRVARERALVPILAMTTDEKVANRLGLVWGVVPVLCEKLKEMGQISPMAIKIAKSKGLAKKNEQIIITAGIPFGYQGSTNLLYIVPVE